LFERKIALRREVERVNDQSATTGDACIEILDIGRAGLLPGIVDFHAFVS
jgi:hypothetical protein